MSQMSSVAAERALRNQAHVRMLLRLRQPAFAAALAAAEQDLSCFACSGTRTERDKQVAPTSLSAGFAILDGTQLRLPEWTGLSQKALVIESGASVTRMGEVGLSRAVIGSRNG